jgi:Na+-transporting methylmalonyl-CoA/oxaloacetate decarboxylase beta subunit
MERIRMRTNGTALLLGAAMRRLGVDAMIFDAEEMESLLERDASIGSVTTEDGAAAVLLPPESNDI